MTSCGVGNAYNIGNQQQAKKNTKNQRLDINRSNSTQSGKFMARLEPLVQRHQKISRLTINNNNQIESCYESQNQLEKIDESYKNQQYDGAGMAAAKSGSISINNRRSKPYSANQPKNKLTAALSSKHTNQMLMSKQFQAAPVTGTSTHYTSNNFATAKNFLPSSVNK